MHSSSTYYLFTKKIQNTHTHKIQKKKPFQNVTLVFGDGVKQKLSGEILTQIAEALPVIGKDLQIFEKKEKDPEIRKMLKTLYAQEDV